MSKGVGMYGHVNSSSTSVGRTNSKESSHWSLMEVALKTVEWMSMLKTIWFEQNIGIEHEDQQCEHRGVNALNQSWAVVVEALEVWAASQ